MSSFFDNFMGGMAFGMLANNPFFGCCFGYGMYGGMYNTVDFGGFANPFPSVFGNLGYMNTDAQPMPTTFANSPFPTVDFTQIGQSIWDTFMNPDSEYNKQVRSVYEQMNKQYEESQKDSKNNNNSYQSQIPFYQAQMMVNPWQFMSTPVVIHKNVNDEQSADLEPDEKDSDKKINYDAQELKGKWSKKQPQLTDQFYNRVVEISKKIKCSPDDLMALMNLETRKTFSPSEKCGISTATGLIQFTDATAKTLGTTTDKLKKMSAVEQLDYVEKYFVHWKKELGIKDQQLSAGDLYALVAQPKNAKNEVLIKQGTKAYADNAKNWDVNKDKKITKTDLAACLDKFRA